MRLGHAILGLVTLFASTAHSIVTKPAVRPPVDATAPAPTADPTPTADEVAAPISTASSIDPAQDDVLSRLTQTDALPTSKVTKTGKAGTGQYITVANPFLHARGLFAASLLGSSEGLTSYVVEPTVSIIGEDYAIPDETITVGLSTYHGVNIFTAAAYTSDGPQYAETLSASCAINSASTAVCSYNYLGGASPQKVERPTPITLTAAQFNTLEVMQGGGTTAAATPTSAGVAGQVTASTSKSTSSTGSAAAATSSKGAASVLDAGAGSLILLLVGVTTLFTSYCA